MLEVRTASIDLRVPDLLEQGEELTGVVDIPVGVEPLAVGSGDDLLRVRGDQSGPGLVRRGGNRGTVFKVVAAHNKCSGQDVVKLTII